MYGRKCHSFNRIEDEWIACRWWKSLDFKCCAMSYLLHAQMWETAAKTCNYDWKRQQNIVRSVSIFFRRKTSLLILRLSHHTLLLLGIWWKNSARGNVGKFFRKHWARFECQKQFVRIKRASGCKWLSKMGTVILCGSSVLAHEIDSWDDAKVYISACIFIQGIV